MNRVLSGRYVVIMVFGGALQKVGQVSGMTHFYVTHTYIEVRVHSEE